MRRPRIKAIGEGFYHVVSRIVGRRFLLDDGEKGILLGMVHSIASPSWGRRNLGGYNRR